MLTGGLYKYSKHLVRRKLHLIFIVCFCYKVILLQFFRLSIGFYNIFVTNCKDCNINHQYSLHNSFLFHSYSSPFSHFKISLASSFIRDRYPCPIHTSPLISKSTVLFSLILSTILANFNVSLSE